MRKVIDFLFLRLAVCIVVFVIFSLFMDSLWLSFGCALSFTILVSVILSLFKGKRRGKGMYYSDFVRYAVLGGNEYIYSILPDILPRGCIVETNKDCMVIENSGRELIVSAIKYGNISPDEVIRWNNRAKELGCDKIYVICKNIDRKATMIANNTGRIFYIIYLRRIFRILAHMGKLPALNLTPKRKRQTIREILSIVLSTANAKRFLVTAAILFAMSFLTPLKTYYYVMSSIALLLCLICMSGIGSKAGRGKRGIFDSIRPKSVNNVNTPEPPKADSSDNQDDNT